MLCKNLAFSATSMFEGLFHQKRIGFLDIELDIELQVLFLNYVTKLPISHYIY